MEQANDNSKLVYSISYKSREQTLCDDESLTHLQYLSIAEVKTFIADDLQKKGKGDDAAQIRSTPLRNEGIGVSFGIVPDYNFDAKVWDDNPRHDFNPNKDGDTLHISLSFAHGRYNIYLWNQNKDGAISGCDKEKSFALQEFAQAWDQAPQQKLPSDMAELKIPTKTVYTITAESNGSDGQSSTLDLGLKSNSSENNMAALKAAIFNHATQRNPAITEQIRSSFLNKKEEKKKGIFEGIFSISSSPYDFELTQSSDYISLSIGDSRYKIYTYTQRSLSSLTAVSVSTPHKQTNASLQVFANEWDATSWPKKDDAHNAHSPSDEEADDIQLIALNDSEEDKTPHQSLVQNDSTKKSVPTLPPQVSSYPVHYSAPNHWPKRIAFFLLNPLTYITPAILVAVGLMIEWVRVGKPLFAEISMLTLGGALGLGAIVTGIAILINFLSIFKEKMPIEEYLAERSKWNYISTAVGMAIFLTMLMVALTLFSDQIPFLDNIFKYLLQGIGVGMGEFAKSIEVSFFVLPEFLNPFSAVLNVLFVLTPAILIDGVGRMATAGKDYQYPDQFVSRQDDAKWTADNQPLKPGQKQGSSPLSQRVGGQTIQTSASISPGGLNSRINKAFN